MSSCPVCSERFQSGNDVRWHLSHEHHRLADEALKFEVERALSVRLDWHVFKEFASASCKGSVSIVLPTTPVVHRGHMVGIDESWLHYLSGKADRLMTKVLRPDDLAVMSWRLSTSIAAVARGPYDKGLAILVNPEKIGIFRLSVAPRARVTVGTEFTVRDLLESLQHSPPYRVLVIGGCQPRLLEGWGAHLEEVAPLGTLSSEDLARRCLHHDVTRGEPPPGVTGAIPGTHELYLREERETLEHWLWSARRQRALVQEADVALSERSVPGSQRPLVVVGPARLLAAWRDYTSCSSPVVGVVRTHRVEATHQVIGQMTAPLVSSWHEAARAVEVACLEHADRHGLIKWGLSAAWSALATGRASELWVGHHFGFAPLDSEAGVILLDRQFGPECHLDDPVEDVIRKALAAGARVHLLEEPISNHAEAIGVQLAPSAQRAVPKEQRRTLPV